MLGLVTQEIEGWPYMGMAHVELVHRDPCECKIRGFRAVSSIERSVSKKNL